MGEDIQNKEDAEVQCKTCNGSVCKFPTNYNDEEISTYACNDCRWIWLDYVEIRKIRPFSKEVDKKFLSKRIHNEQDQSDKIEKKKKEILKPEKKQIKNTVSKASVDVRNQFIAKTYKLFFFSLAFCATGASVGVSLKLDYSHILYLCIIEILVFIWALVVRKNKAWNRMALFTYASVSGLSIAPLLGMIIGRGNGAAIPFSLIITTLIFASLSLYVHTTKKDFSAWRGFLFSSLWVLIIAGVLSFFKPNLINPIIYSSISILIFCGFILYDTSRILLKYEVTEYVAATIDLYLDFIIIFTDLLHITGVDTESIVDVVDIVDEIDFPDIDI